ncbi:MAG: NADH-quinone oxidoreductase subunit C [Candidatus Dormibacteria bacterium]
MSASPNPAAGPAEVLDLVHQVLDELVPGAVLKVVAARPEASLLLDAGALTRAAQVLRDDPRLRFTMPLFVTAVDWLDRAPRFDVVYQFRSLHLNTSLRIKVGVEDRPDGLPSIPSLSGVWPGMNWLERETYDLFGIEFEGHPDQRRLLMPVDWEGHPLRKDYVSFGEPVKFTDRGSFPPESAVPRGGPG